jgi:hypothetical protein
MSDARRRALERDASHGDPDAAAALLAERLRAGEVTRERVALAALLGDPAARAVVGAAAVADDAFFAALASAGDDACLRAVLAAVRLAFDPVLAVAAGPDWIAGACRPGHAGAIAARGQALARQRQAFAERYGTGAQVSFGPFDDCGCVAAGVSAFEAPDLLRSLASPHVVSWLPGGTTAAEVRRAIEAALLPWAVR